LIELTRFDGSTFYINPELIRSIEHTPDTVITLVDDYKIVVKDKIEDVISRFIQYQKDVHGNFLLSSIAQKHKEE
jgi:flagellar protein FlbD